MEKSSLQKLTEIVEEMLQQSPNLVSKTALHRAVYNDHLAAVALLLAVSTDFVEAVDGLGTTALHCAAIRGRSEIVALLLKASPDLINVADKDGLTALHHAAYNGNLKVVAQLLVVHPDLINVTDKHGRIALNYAAYNGHHEGVALLANPDLIHTVDFGSAAPLSHVLTLQFDYDEIVAQLLAANFFLTSEVDSKGQTVLHIAASNRWIQIVEMLVTTNPHLIKAVDFNGKTALDVASWPRVEARILAEDPSQLERVCPVRGETALHFVARHCYARGVVRLLARCPEAINMVDSNGDTVLHCAVWCGRETMAHLLAVASPRIINTINSKGLSALHCAVAGERYEVAEQLLGVTSPDVINIADKRGRTVLHFANDKIADRLLSKSHYLLEKVDSDGMNALHHAIARDQDSVVEMLLDIKPELLYSTDKRGNTVLHLASRRHMYKLFERLFRLNPSLTYVVDCEGRTPLDVAIRVNNQDVVAMIQVMFSFDEVVTAFNPPDKQFLRITEHAEERFLRPVVERQCEGLSGVLHKDVAGVVFEYLGFETRKRQTHSDESSGNNKRLKTHVGVSHMHTRTMKQ